MEISIDEIFSLKGPQIAGAMLAFGVLAAISASLFNDKRRKAKNKAEQITAVNQALHIISSVRNSLALYQKETIEPALASEAPWLKMEAQADGQIKTINFPDDALMFLLKTEHADLFADYLAEERRYLELLGFIRERSKIILDTVRPELEQDIEPDLATQLKELTRDIITHTNQNIESLENFYHTFRKAMKEHLGGEKISEVTFEK